MDSGSPDDSASTTGVDGSPIRLGVTAIGMLIDVAMWVLLYYRPYGWDESQGPDGDGWNRLVSHYFSWMTITDTFGLWLSPERRHWWSPFRLLGSVQLLVFVVTMLALKVEDGVALWLTFARLALILARLVHSAICLWVYGPTKANIDAFPAQASKVLNMSKFLAKLPVFHLVLATAAVLLPNVLYVLHYNYGKYEVDGALVGWQACSGISGFVKMWVIDIMVEDPLKRGLATLLIFALFLAQWPLMPEMFTKALIAYAHIAAELVFLVVGLGMLLLWMCYQPQEDTESNVAPADVEAVEFKTQEKTLSSE